MSDMNISTLSAASRFSHLFRPAQQGGAPASAPTFAGDQLNLVTGGAGTAPQGEYAQFVADTVAMLNSTDVRQRFQAIINMTKMQPAEAVPLLQKASQDSNPQVQQLAQRALSVMQQMQQATPAPGAAPATPAVPATPAAPATPATPPAPVAAPSAPAAPTAPVAPPAPPAAPAAPATPATPAAPAAPPAPVQMVQPAQVTNAGPGQNTATLRALEADIKAGADPVTVMPKIAAYAQTDRAECLRVLLTYLTNGSNARAMELAIGVLRDMKANEAIPYLEAITRQNYQTPETVKAAADGISALSNANGTPGAANAQGGVYAVRALEVKAKAGGNEAVQAIQQLAPLAESQKQEVTRVILTVLHSPKDTASAMAAINLARQLKVKEALPYLQYLMTLNYQPEIVRQAASAGVQELNGASATPATPAAPAATAPAATPATPATPAQPAAQTQTVPATPAAPATQQPSNIPGFLRQ